MDNKRAELNENDLDKVVGGLFEWYPKYNVMKYTHDDGSVTKHTIVDYEKGWDLSTRLHAQSVPEDEILSRLITAGYIAG